MEELHKRLRRLRTERGYSAKEFSKKIGVPESTYREWEYGRPLSGPPFVKIAEALLVPLTFLMTGEKAPHEGMLNEIAEIQARLSKLSQELSSRI